MSMGSFIVFLLSSSLVFYCCRFPAIALICFTQVCRERYLYIYIPVSSDSITFPFVGAKDDRRGPLLWPTAVAASLPSVTPPP